MDYKTFLDFVLAMENKKTPESIQYFWKVFFSLFLNIILILYFYMQILDVYHKGAVDSFVINMFFKPII